MITPGRWVEDLPGQTPVGRALRAILKRRLGAMAALLEDAADDEGGRGGNARLVHGLRVSARRTEAALRLFEPVIDRAGDKLRRAVRRVRRAAGTIRDCDIHSEILLELRGRANEPQLPVVEFLIGRAMDRRGAALARLRRAARDHDAGRLRRWRRSVVNEAEGERRTLDDLARERLPAMAQAAREAAAADLSDMANLHELRLAGKRLRYGLELAAGVVGPVAAGQTLAGLGELQEQLGEVNDCETLLIWIEGEEAELENRGGGTSGRARSAASLVAGLRTLRERYWAVRDHRVERFMGWWAAFDCEGLLRLVEEALRPARPGPAPEAPAEVAVTTAHNGSAHRESNSGAIRLAAIDVGSNTTRLVIAEAHADGSYRILDDEKELTRLAQGLVRTGRLDAAVMDHAATVVARLRAIADGYGCSAIRAVATAAVREAANRDEFVALVRVRAGVDLRVISAEEEARLAYQSVAQAFGDMRNLSAGVVDIGGGSTEIVLSLRGVVEEVYTFPIGAVSLTERFGGAEASAGRRFKAMRRWIRSELRRRMPSPGLRPDLIVGTGGTVTALAAMAIKRDRRAGPLAPATVQGYQIRRGAVRRILEDLRDMSLEERAGVPGLSAERADIIVAGVAVVEAVMRRLRTRRLRVHTLGIRDGLLQSMAREVLGPVERTGAKGGRLAAARRLAQACRYEEAHSEHVAELALRIFDGLSPLRPRPETLWAEPVARELLEAAAVMHDIGYIVNYAQHHKHGYHLIVHADLTGDGGLSRREVEVVANLVRYHRRAEPKESHATFAALAEEDRRLVRYLGAILRIADGLDRTHTQNVRDVRVRLEPGVCVFVLEAAADPATDVWGASRKAGMFGEVFGVEARFEWARAGGGARPVVVMRPVEVRAPQAAATE